uniref:3-hydroxyisobutyryl-CoA hydrolase n=1 Tax=Salix viminalis TaxID=40686 RepID=A0A6N2KLX7_SALVM
MKLAETGLTFVCQKIKWPDFINVAVEVGWESRFTSPMAIRHCFDKDVDQVLFEGNSSVKRVILNRPHKLNSLSYHMIFQMIKELKAFEADPKVKIVILKGNGKAFCAGGDVLASYTCLVAGHWSYGTNFYKKQAMLDYLVATYGKPVVAIIDGIVMGGGAGLSLQATFRIVTENTVFAMPETAIGHFADVGSSYFLSRLPGFYGCPFVGNCTR